MTQLVSRPAEIRLPELPDRYNAATTYVDAHRELRPDKVAIRCQGKSVTYGEYAANVDRAGNALRELGIDIEDRVVILCLDSPAFVYAFFGAIKIGAVPVPTNTLLIARDLTYILRDSRARAVVVSAPLLQKVLDVRKDCPRLRHVLVTTSGTAPLDGPLPKDVISFEEACAAADKTLTPADTTPDDMCFWLYSSGTTGFPKGAVHLQHDMIYSAETFGRHVLCCTEDDRYFTVSPLFHAYGLGNGVFVPFRFGASAVYKPERATPDVVYGLVTTERPTVMYTAPTFYAALLAYPEEGFKYDLSSLKFCVSAGEALPKPLFDRWKARFGTEIIDGIGSTEMLHIFICNRVGSARGGTSGTVVPGYRAKIVDDEGRELGPGDTGNLWVSGDSCCAFYWNKHEKSKATFKGDWTVTGDRYHLSEDGFFSYEGRSDDMLKVSGQWVSPAEVEAAVMEHPAVLECAVVGAKDKDELTKPRAFVLLKDKAKASDGLDEELKSFVKSRIAPYKYPRWIEFVDDLPKTATGKIQRYKLRERG
ncbi:MAG TPA: benzoate-CoA ligase family protein [Candidatus Acidoferrales bacterium]|nr:benzoate-CoA ligase family protein [Candidatus Acidoferrales bacterium]